MTRLLVASGLVAWVGLTLLLAEQNLGFARAVAEDAVVLHKGHVAETRSMTALADDPELRRQYLAV